MTTWAEHLFSFYKNLQPPQPLPNNVEWLYPQQQPEIIEIVKNFLYKFFNDANERTLMLGINPGRFGAGVTGVNFTAPKQLTENCKINHSLKMQTELSAEFIYEMIEAYGGTKKFYANFFIGSVSPLGFVKNGTNINYYDDKELLQFVEPFLINTIHQQVKFPVNKEVCYSIGGEKNFKYLLKLNQEHSFFKKIIPLPHPRFIMQYKRKQKQKFIYHYLDFLKNK